MKDKTLVILALRKESTNIIYNSLKRDFQIEKIIIERPISKILFLKRRIKKLGLTKVFGQILFRLIAVPYLNLFSYKRIQELKKSFGLVDKSIGMSKIINISSVNSDTAMRMLKEINPDLVIINGIRIISERIFNCVPAKFINLHMGITPLYRGVQGAYWALVENNQKACGVTIHFVDSGVDTGKILQQGLIKPEPEDNLVTYPLLQLAVGIPLLKKAIRDIFENRVEIKLPPEGPSRLWFHPTVWEYIWYRVHLGVK